MGILNVTPDSFSDGGKFTSIDSALKHAEQMIKDGADIIDVGGESTRPGSQSVSESEELDRVIPIIEKLKNICNFISIDTVKPLIAEEAFKAGASILNDISGMQFHPEIASISAKYKAAVVLMHIQGKPQTMQKAPKYDNLLSEISDYLQKCIKTAENAGIASDSIVIDPGIGFGKSLDDNLSILKHLDYFKTLNKPLLIGVSRKSFIGMISDVEVKDRLAGTLAAITAARLKGASIFRVHDVKECKQALEVADRLIPTFAKASVDRQKEQGTRIKEENKNIKKSQPPNRPTVQPTNQS